MTSQAVVSQTTLSDKPIIKSSVRFYSPRSYFFYKHHVSWNSCLPPHPIWMSQTFYAILFLQFFLQPMLRSLFIVLSEGHRHHTRHNINVRQLKTRTVTFQSCFFSRMAIDWNALLQNTLATNHSTALKKNYYVILNFGLMEFILHFYAYPNNAFVFVTLYLSFVAIYRLCYAFKGFMRFSNKWMNWTGHLTDMCLLRKKYGLCLCIGGTSASDCSDVSHLRGCLQSEVPARSHRPGGYAPAHWLCPCKVESMG